MKNDAYDFFPMEAASLNMKVKIPMLLQKWESQRVAAKQSSALLFCDRTMGRIITLKIISHICQ